jgi:hypothetical protein
MSDKTAYRTADYAVLSAWKKYAEDREALRLKRHELALRFGRNIMVRGSSFGHGTTVVGFERTEDDRDGDTPHDGVLRVKKHDSTVGPNIRRKAGKDLAEEMARLSSPELSLPGMPAWHMGDTDRGMAILRPALWHSDGTVYALWGSDSVPVDDNWERISLSEYYAAKESHDAEVSE